MSLGLASVILTLPKSLTLSYRFSIAISIGSYVNNRAIYIHAHLAAAGTAANVAVPATAKRSYYSLFFSSWMFRHRPLISLHSTSNETGVPASRVLRPMTIDS